MRHIYALVVPALNEAESVGILLGRIPRELFSQTIVVDNGSQDRTGEVAAAAGAQVVTEPRRGYGQACLSGIRQVQPSVTAIAFMDADLSDDPMDLTRLARRFENDALDLAIGSRVLGSSEPGSLTPLQRFGNWLTTALIRSIWKVSFTDLGPMRMIGCDALERLRLRDPDFGWNVEMQAKAARLRLRIAEIPVQYRKRRFGKSKISGTITGSVRAGAKILWTVYRCWRSDLQEDEAPTPLRA